MNKKYHLFTWDRSESGDEHFKGSFISFEDACLEFDKSFSIECADAAIYETQSDKGIKCIYQLSEISGVMKWREIK